MGRISLKLEVELEDVAAEDVEQMRIALQDLGLDDDVWRAKGRLLRHQYEAGLQEVYG